MVQGFKKRLLVQIGVALGLILLFAIFIVLLNSDINKRGLSIGESKAKLTLRNKTIELLSNSNNDLKRAEPLFENLKNILPNQDQLVGFPEELTKLAKGYGVDVGFNWKKGGVPSTASDAGTILFDLTLSGQYDDVDDFLKAFERHRYLIKLDGIEMIRTDRGPNIFSLKTSGKIFIN